MNIYFALILSLSVVTSMAAETPSKAPQKNSSKVTPKEAPTESSKQVETPPLEKAVDKAAEAIQGAEEKVESFSATSADLRSKSVMSLKGYLSPIGILIPLRYGASLGYIMTKNTSFEAQYFYGSIKPPFIEELAKFSETQINLNARLYAGNSFNFILGVGYRKISATIGNVIFDRIPGGQFLPGIDILTFESYGLNLGVGNCWQAESGFTFGVDWIVVHQPVIVTKSDIPARNYITNSSDKDAMDKAESLMKYLPSIALLNINAGWTF